MWYRIIRASRFLGVPPWELASAPLFWLNAAEESMVAEAAAQKAQANQPGRR